MIEQNGKQNQLIKYMSQFNKHYQGFHLPQMKANPKFAKANNETIDVYLQGKQIDHSHFNNISFKNQNNYDTIKTHSKKSISVNQGKNATIQSNQRQYFKISAKNSIKQGNKRYEEEQIRKSSKNPYIKKQNKEGRSTSLNRSAQKMKPNRLVKQSEDFYRQPKSSFSRHQEKQQIYNKRMNENKLEKAKLHYNRKQFDLSITILEKLMRSNKTEPQIHYFLGMSLINNNEFIVGINELKQTLKIDPKYKKSLYLVIALALKKLDKIDEAIEILTVGLKYFPDYYDCLVYRGKMYLKEESYQLARNDFALAVQLNSKKGFAHFGKGVAERQLGKLTQAIQSFSFGIGTDMRNNCLEKRGFCYYDLSKFQLAIRDFEACTQNITTSTPSIHHLKGMIYYRLKKPIDALLSFEECLKYDSNQENITESVEMMIKIKIEEKDFYEAYHILNRSYHFQIKKQRIEEWRLFLEGTLSLMKKKCKDGLKIYNSLLQFPIYTKKYSSLDYKKEKERYSFLKPLIHLYKGFGELGQGNYEQAQKDYKAYDDLCKELRVNDKNLSKQYNTILIKANDRFPFNCLKLFQDATSLIPNKPQPYLFLTFEKVQNNLLKETEKKSENIEFIIKNLTEGISLLPQLSNNHISTFYYYRSIMYLYKNQFSKAVADIDKAIQKSEDNIPKYFHLRGLIFAIFGNFSQSIQDLSVAISLDEKFAKPYLQRAKCLQIEGNSNQAFLDLQKYITLHPQDPKIHKYAGFLLFQNCAYEDCLAAFSHGSEDSNDIEMVLTKAKCHFLLNHTELAVTYFKKYEKQSYSTQFLRDVEMMKLCSLIQPSIKSDDYFLLIDRLRQVLKEVKNEQEYKIFKLRDLHQIQGSIWLIMGHYEKSLEEFEESLKLFRKQKKREMEKQIIENQIEFQNQWSEVEIKFNMALSYLCLKKYERAKNIVAEFQQSTEKGKDWDLLCKIIDQLIQRKVSVTKKQQIDVFDQQHRISKNWPKIKLPGFQIYFSMAFSYPFVDPPQMLPQFDEKLFQQFHFKNVEIKPEAPWLTRLQKGLVFTQNIQKFDNLQLSITTNNQNEESEINKQISEMDQSMGLSNSGFQMETDGLKERFKLDSEVEMKLNKLMQKK